VNVEKLEDIISETEALLMGGEFSARFNRYLVQTMTPSAPPAAPAKTTTTPPTPAVQSDAELRALKAKLQAELEEVAGLKAGLAARERTLREGEQKLREQEQAFAEKCKREQASLDEARAALVPREEEIELKARQAAEKQAEELARLEEVKAELAARSQFIEESEQRLLIKGQEQIEHLAELEQKEEELMATKKELNGMRKELGLPLIPLRAKPVDEFEE
jgi:multidrug efflux pump subunit AcrA (membrane-fusion protein)